MKKSRSKRPFPENLRYKKKIREAGMTVNDMANKIGVSRCVLSRTLNGWYNGSNYILPRVRKELGLDEMEMENNQ